MNTATSQNSEASGSTVPGPILQMSHAATRVKDMRETRRFYEDFLNLPMSVTMTIDNDPVTKTYTNYVHCFFQVSDGSFLAFFQFEDGTRDEMLPHTSDVFERHLALRVDSLEDAKAYEEKAKEMCFETFTIDHVDFFSLYVLDPDGDQIEITWYKPSLVGLVDVEAAHKMLDEWLIKANALWT